MDGMVSRNQQNETSYNRRQYRKRLERYYRRLSAEMPDKDLPRFADDELELFLGELRDLIGSQGSKVAQAA